MWPLAHVAAPVALAHLLAARWPRLAAVDHRLLAAGALLPDVLDKLALGALGAATSKGPGHTLALALALLALAAVPRLRLPLACLGAGALSHLLLDQPWAWPAVLLWPLLGAEPWRPFHAEASLAAGSTPLVALGEVAGAMVLLGVAWSAGLRRPEARRRLAVTGRLAPPPPRPSKG